MSFLKPRIPKIKISGTEYELIYTLDIIDNIQDRAKMSMTEIMMWLIEGSIETRKMSAKVLIECLTGQLIEIEDDELEFYSSLLTHIYIQQMKCKEIPGLQKKLIQDGEYEFIDIEYWIYIGTVVLNRAENDVWKMTLGKIRTLYNEHAKFSGWIKEEKEQSLLNI